MPSLYLIYVKDKRQFIAIPGIVKTEIIVLSADVNSSTRF